MAWSSVSNAFELHAGMEFIRIAVFGQLRGNVPQRRCIRRVNQCSKVAIGLLPRLCPEPKSGEQGRSVFNEVVAGVDNEVMGGVDGGGSDVCPDLLLRLVFELSESAHASAVSHRELSGHHQGPWSSRMKAGLDGLACPSSTQATEQRVRNAGPTARVSGKAHNTAVAVRGIRLGGYPDLRPDGATASFQGTRARFRVSPPPSWSPFPATLVAREKWLLSRGLALRFVVDHQFSPRI